MNTNKALAVGFFLSVCNTFSQGTILFQTYLDSNQAVPPNSSTRVADGSFELYSDSTFTGGIWIENYPGITTVSLFRATSVSDIGTKLFDMTPGAIEAPRPGGGGGGQEFGLDRLVPLTSADVSDLQSGLWWVSVITPQYPNGEIRGQITAVPEPATTALFIVAAGIVGLIRRNRAEETD
jgi:hypothetical protein